MSATRTTRTSTKVNDDEACATSLLGQKKDDGGDDGGDGGGGGDDERLGGNNIDSHNADVKNSWIDEGLQRHRRVVQELLQKHRESVQVQKMFLEHMKKHQKQQQQNLWSSNYHRLLLTEGQSISNDISLTREKSVDNTTIDTTGEGGSGGGSSSEVVWSREISVKNLHNYHDSDFILVPQRQQQQQQQDEFYESSEKQREEYENDSDGSGEEFRHNSVCSSRSDAEASSSTTTKSSGESAQYHDCRYSDSYDDDSSEEVSSNDIDILHSSAKDNQSEKDKPNDRQQQQQQHLDLPVDSTDERPITSVTNEFVTDLSSSASKSDHNGGSRKSPILSLSELPATAATTTATATMISNDTNVSSSSECIINEQNISEDNQMQTSIISKNDQNVFEEEQKMIEDIFDSMNATAQVSETARVDTVNSDTKDNTKAGFRESEEISEQNRRSSEEQDAIDDILDGFFGEMDSLDDMEADKNKPFFPSPPTCPKTRSDVCESDEDENSSRNEDSSRSDDSSNLKDSSHAESIESSSEDDDDDDDDDEQSDNSDDQSSSSPLSDDKSSTSAKSSLTPLPVNSTYFHADDDVVKDTKNLANEGEISEVQQGLQPEKTAVPQKSDADEIDDILDFFLDEMDSMDANDRTEEKVGTKKRPSFDASQVSDSSSENTSEKADKNRSRTNSMASNTKSLTSAVSDSFPSATMETPIQGPKIAIGGATSVFTTAVAVSSDPTMETLSSNAVATNSSYDNSVSKSPRIEHAVILPTGAQMKDLVSNKLDGGAVSPFTPLYESKSRIATPDLNIQTDDNVVQSAIDKSEQATLGVSESCHEEKRPHDPVATALFENSSGLKMEEAIVGKEDGDKHIAEVLMEDESSAMDNEILSEPLSPVPPSKLSNEGHSQVSRPCSPSSAASPIPDFQIQSVSTMSGSPLSHLISFDRVGIDSETPEQMTPVIEIDAMPAAFLPDLFEKDKIDPKDQLESANDSKASSKDNKEPATRTLKIDPYIPFSRTNTRMERRKNEHNDKPTSPHKVETSRVPFQGPSFDETDDAGVSVAALSTPGRASSVCSSIRGFHSLASPPRSFIPPTTTTPASIRLVSRTPTDSKSIAKSKLVLCQKIAAPSYHHQSVRVCTNKFIYNLHSKLGPCDRCWALASRDEQERFLERGTHLRIARTRGGCDRSCTIFPPLRTTSSVMEDGSKVVKDGKECGLKLKEGSTEPPIRLCRQCFFATHQRDGSRISVYRGNHIKVKSTM